MYGVLNSNRHIYHRNNSMNFLLTGTYPCFCGSIDKAFGDQCLFNSTGPFNTIAECVQLLDKTDIWRVSTRNGNIAPFDTMKVSNREVYFQLVMSTSWQNAYTKEAWACFTSCRIFEPSSNIVPMLQVNGIKLQLKKEPFHLITRKPQN